MHAVKEHTHGTPAFPAAAYPIDYVYDPNGLFFPHYHPELEFFLLAGGDATMNINGIPIQMHPGDSVIISSYAIHSMKALSPCECKTIAVLCHPDFLRGRNEPDAVFCDYLKQLTDRSSTAIHLRAGQSASYQANLLFRQMRRLFDERPKAYELLIKAKLLELLFLTFSASNLRELRQEIDPAVSVILGSLDYIHAHLSEDLTLDQLAAQAHLSPSQYGRLFKRTMEVTPVSYIIENRIVTARRLLELGRKRISDVAIEVGFRNFSYFNRCFLRYTGVTPGEFRKRSAAGKA